MKKTNEEFKAEVFRRRDEYYKKRNRIIRTAAIASAPLACLTAFIIAVFPAMMPASKEAPSYHYSATDEALGEQIRINVKEILCVKYESGAYIGENTATVPEGKREELLDFLVYVSASAEDATEKTGIPTEATTTTATSRPYYKIILNYEVGNPRTYTVYKKINSDAFYIADGAATFALTYSQLKFIESILG